MEVHEVKNMEGLFFNGFDLLKGSITSENENDSVYFKRLDATVIYSKPLYFTRSWNHGYYYSNWDWNEYEYIPTSALIGGLQGYLDFIQSATYEQLKAYFKLKDLMQTEDFVECNIQFN